MGRCVFCQLDAGSMKSEHRECRQKKESGPGEMAALALATITSGMGAQTLKSRLSDTAKATFQGPEKIKSALLTAWDQALDAFLADGELSKSEVDTLSRWADDVGLSPEDLDLVGGRARVLKASLLRTLMEGQLPDVKIEGILPFNLQKDEQIIWLFHDVDLLEHKTQRTYMGRSSGMSFRIAKGVYYRTGQFRGHPVETTHLATIDRGRFAATTKHVYFTGGSKSFRIPFSKIVSFEPFSDGVGITKDGVKAKPQFFKTGDGWFTCNLLNSLSQR
jgi:hypothetical protein